MSRIEPARALLGGVFIVAGIVHFVWTPVFASIVPDYLPAHRDLVMISGVAEMSGGLGVLLPPTRRAAAVGLAVLLVAVFPANLWMARHPGRFPSLPEWLLWLRVPLQIPLVAWALLYARRRPQ